jgi:hypothetical protein
MNQRLTQRLLSTLSACGAAFICWSWLHPPARSPAAPTAAFGPADYPAIFDPDALSQAAADVIEGNLFRPDRTAPAASDGPASPPAPAAPPIPRPKFVLRGVIGGPPWDAIIDGLPGRPGGTVVRNGESIGGFSITVRSRDTVRVRGDDTVWTLTLGRA